MASRSAASFGEMLTCLLMNWSSYLIQQERLLKNRFWLEKRLNSVFAIFAADAGVLKSAPGCLGIVGHGIDHDATGSQLGRASWTTTFRPTGRRRRRVRRAFPRLGEKADAHSQRTLP